jgi:pimeloyl-ACP methyl ester carboxylesterase
MDDSHEVHENHVFKQGEDYIHSQLVFLHDVGSSSRIWQPIIDDHAQSFSCYAMDFAGHITFSRTY